MESKASHVKKVQLNTYENSWYKPGASWKRGLWYLINFLFFKTSLPIPSVLKKSLLRLFGAEVGKGVVLKPNISIKYPWMLAIADHVWIGEGVWIDNLDRVKLSSNVCLSQGAMLLCGNHNYKSTSFDLIVHPITLEDGVWIGAKAIVCPGVTCGSHAVLSVGSVATNNLEPYSIYAGNPAVKVRAREISDKKN